MPRLPDRLPLARMTVLCVLLGVAVTVGVSWAAMLVPATPTTRTVGWRVIPSRHGRVQAHDQHLGATRMTRLMQVPAEEEPRYWSRVASGWPALAMAYEIEHGPAYEVHAGLEPPAQLVAKDGLVRDYHRLPLMPTWPGFGVNVAVYAGLSWLGLFAPFTLRRAMRRRRGRCVRCGYDLAGLTPCPECGAGR